MATMTTSKVDIMTLQSVMQNTRNQNGPVDCTHYSASIDSIRQQEYPALSETTYLDHAGTTLYAKSLIDSYASELTRNIFGNPHSASNSSQLSSRRIDDVRLKVLKFLNASPEQFDVVFVANATAAVKLVADAFRDEDQGFWYGYHADSHTSLVGVRELARLGSICFRDDEAMQSWISTIDLHQEYSRDHPVLLSYPGQSNMTGRRLPLDWCRQLRRASHRTGYQAYSLFDAAALASTSPIDLSDALAAPDFTTLSFYKIFGFPDLGALVVRKDSGHMLKRRLYFGGGTVDAVSSCGEDVWHMKKENLHDALEDGTLPFHNIVALDHAMRVHSRIFGSMSCIAKHVTNLCLDLYGRMDRLRHYNGSPVCEIHGRQISSVSSHGPTVAFNLLDSDGRYVSNAEVEKLAFVKNIHLRTGGLCNPGGVAKHLKLRNEEIKKNYALGQRCGSENDIVNGSPTGVIRVSLGAMSGSTDVDSFISFLEEFYVSRTTRCNELRPTTSSLDASGFFVESMSVFPIKSCAAFNIPANVDWDVSADGLAWDREWCLVHQGTNKALSQKQYPRMALLRPTVDIKKRILHVSFTSETVRREINIGLDEFPSTAAYFKVCSFLRKSESLVCGESVPLYIYTLPDINDFFSNILEVPCALARFSESKSRPRTARLRTPRSKILQTPGISPASSTIKLSNESPILLISRSSVNELNQQIQRSGTLPQEISSDSFRANIVVSEHISNHEIESPYAEDAWNRLSIRSEKSPSTFSVLGPCQRCQMVCVDQSSAKRRSEPFNTLAKTRRWGGGVWFGVHLCLTNHGSNSDTCRTTLRVGDALFPS